jgi:CheY-like chemotaxis protein
MKMLQQWKRIGFKAFVPVLFFFGLFFSSNVIGAVVRISLLPPVVLDAGGGFSALNGYKFLFAICFLIIALLLFLIYYFNRRNFRIIQEIKNDETRREEHNKRILERFFAGISYDIRTPLNGIVGSTELIRMDKDPSNTEKYLNILSVASANLCTTVADLIDFSRFGNTDIKFESNTFSIHELLGELVDLHQHRAAEKKLRFELLIDKKIPMYLIGDHGKLRQLIMTYLRLGILNSDRGIVGLGCELIRTSGSVVELRFTINDTGNIYTDKQIEKQLLSDSTNYSFIDYLDPDSPSRLAVARNIIELMGGNTGIESKGGKGNYYWFTCNLNLASENTASINHHQLNLSGMNVMVIDDDMTSRALFRQYLGFYQCNSVEKTTMEDALTYLQRDDSPVIHAIILSLPIRTVEAQRLARSLVSRAGKPKLPVIFISAEGAAFSKEDLKEFGFHSTLTKPFRVVDFFYSLYELAPKIFTSFAKSNPDTDDLKNYSIDILLVEDDLISEKVASATLTRLGFRVEIARNGKVGLQKYIEKPYRYVFMDILMPEMNGLETTRKIREFERVHPDRKPSTIIALTAETITVTKAQCIESGMNDYISKPFRLEELQKVLSL